VFIIEINHRFSDLPGLVLLDLDQLHWLAVADEFPPASFTHKNDISADIAPVHLTGLLDIYHTIHSGSRPYRASIVP